VSEPEREFSIFVPPELEAGVYANLLQASYSTHEFTLDFCVSVPAEEIDEEARFRVVSRIKVPVTIMLETIRRVNEVMTHYEDKFGEIGKPGE